MSIASKLPWQRPLFTCISWVFLLRYLRIIEGTPEQHLRGRKLLFNVNRDLVPLSCNANIDQATCLNWSVKFGSNSFYSTRVVVPCGECVIMDHFGNITFNDGLDIVGKLVFPDGYRVNVYSTLVVVQGILDMKATGAVTGTPSIQFIMIGNNMETVFTPVDTNANACGGNICSTGKKGIVVAGGTVNLHGLPPDTPTWVHLYDVMQGDGPSVNQPDTIFLPKSVAGKWSVGAEILITSHTPVWNAVQVRKIRSLSTFFAPMTGQVSVKLNETIVRPTTIKESADFAVEVALLSRNIVFRGGPDDVANHGGHFMVLFTPTVVQTIEGVEFRNFGQQGELGRYPIHFHYCNDVTGSVVSKNSIRESSQRCVVVHGTNKLRIQENVAFDTKGHCFMTEDGIETENEFLYNLGAKTGIPLQIIPNDGTNGNETDGQPSTFWITNPTNTFIGNVAAGSQHTGYWFEPKKRGIRIYLYPNYDPIYAPLGIFRDNVAHSNTGLTLGAIRTYTPGYRPLEVASLDGLKVYRNVGSGIFIHRCHNIKVENSLFADNDVGIDIDRAEGIEVNNTVIIGESNSYRTLMARQDVRAICGRQGLIGLELFTWKVNTSYAGAKISNVEFHGFDSIAACSKVSSISFDSHTLKQGLFEFYTTFQGISFYSNYLGGNTTDSDKSVNLCVVESSELIKMVYVIDLDGSLSPSTVTPKGPSTLLASDDSALLTFVDSSKCTYVADGCYNYCQDSCFRSFRFLYEGAGQDSLTLKVCRMDNALLCSYFTGGRRSSRDGPHTYIAHLPVGFLYSAIFLDGSGLEVTTGTLYESYEDGSACDGIFSLTYVGSLSATSVADTSVLDYLAEYEN